MKTRQVVLFNQLKSYREELVNIVEEVTEMEADRIPEGFNNNIRWNLGHVYLDQYLWIQALTREKRAETAKLNDWFGFGTDPADFTKDTPSLDMLKALLKRQPDVIEEEYGERLEETFPPIEMGMETIEQVLIRTIFHEGMHTQAILDIKKYLNREERHISI
ncbi:DinB family protein [Alteribacter keqinensis]|uniref:DinB family protein n=1 Tax=Alteribacter keqinensis TaxID=2483800 RepID=A0A3M7U0H5_9BACI|nr:DinB family protein [Alteribacter keqinensis]RNA70195.1 DinB family protein [Alteribacter keqinensis]